MNSKSIPITRRRRNSGSERHTHIAIRIPLTANVRGQKFNIVDAHNAVIEKSGRVALAKFGQAGTTARAEQLQKQIDGGARTLLILIIKRGNEFLGFQSQLNRVYHGQPSRDLLSAAPDYYSHLDERPQLWFLVDSLFDKTDLSQFSLVSSGRPLIEVIGECRTSSMLVEVEKAARLLT